ncbi:MAG: tetratricopeptide repeat protein [Planctomycetota bacterium]|nr:MAG: tetratricopeptide repeat protein [Planctomycetota bacterium]
MTEADGASTSPGEQAFDRYLDLLLSGERPDPEAFIAAQPPEVRTGLRRAIDKYELLRRRLELHAPEAAAGRVLGEFRLLRELGRGGMGVVWEAEQIPLRRTVALKLLPPEFGLHPVRLERFQREAEAGARVAHPGVVAIYGVGEHAGAHYIAQELVPGGRTLADEIARLRQRADLEPDHYRRLAERVALVADALEALHQAGVIHRDVKPGNVLIAPDGRPKVNDFGLAHVEDALALTRTGDYAGTPFYMSPEQVAGGRGITARSDQFSLGAACYELLTLSRPFDGDSSQQVMDKIRSQDPPYPTRLRSGIPRELAAITMKALEKDPQRRYPSMAALAGDLRRFLRHEPVLARPPGPWERARKWVRRHPGPALAAAAAALTFAAVAWALLQSRAAERRTLDALATADQVTEFLVRIFEGAGPARAHGERLSASDVLRTGLSRVRTDLDEQPKTRVELLTTVGRVYRALGDLDAAAALLAESAQTALEILGPRHETTLRAQAELVSVHLDRAELDAAERLLARCRDVAFRTLPEGHYVRLRLECSSALLRSLRGDRAGAEQETQRLLATALRTQGPDSPITFSLIRNLAIGARRSGDYDMSVRLLAGAWETQKSLHGPDDPDALNAQYHLAHTLYSASRFGEAEPMLRDVLARAQRVLGPEHPDCLDIESTLGMLYVEQQRWDDAQELYRRVIALQERVLGPAHFDRLVNQHNLAVVLMQSGRYDEARQLLEEVLAAQTATWGPEHADTLATRARLAIVRARMGQAAPAQAELEAVLGIQRRTLGGDDANTLRTQYQLAEVHALAERLDDAIALLEATAAAQERRYGIGNTDTVNSLQYLAELCQQNGEPVRAAAAWRRLCSARPEDPYVHNAFAWIVSDPDRPIPGFEDEAVLAATLAVELAALEDRPIYRDTLAWALYAAGRDDEALEQSARALGEVPGELKAEYQGYLERLQSQVRARTRP